MKLLSLRNILLAVAAYLLVNIAVGFYLGVSGNPMPPLEMILTFAVYALFVFPFALVSGWEPWALVAALLVVVLLHVKFGPPRWFWVTITVSLLLIEVMSLIGMAHFSA